MNKLSEGFGPTKEDIEDSLYPMEKGTVEGLRIHKSVEPIQQERKNLSEFPVQPLLTKEEMENFRVSLHVLYHQDSCMDIVHTLNKRGPMQLRPIAKAIKINMHRIMANFHIGEFNHNYPIRGVFTK